MKITIETKATTEAVFLANEIVQDIINFKDDFLEADIELNVLRSESNFFELNFDGIITAEDKQSVYNLLESEIKPRLPEESETQITE
tara:strand:+ start:1395 stop:1655 length:261 start_codon:yes stop_codon:yes gene_type:complete